jgi:hypothetical protein
MRPRCAIARRKEDYFVFLPIPDTIIIPGSAVAMAARQCPPGTGRGRRASEWQPPTASDTPPALQRHN